MKGLYRKFPKYSDTQNICSNHSKIWTMWVYHTVMCPNDVDRMANSVDPDQTAPLRAVWSGSALFAQAYLSENLGSLRYLILWALKFLPLHNRCRPKLKHVFLSFLCSWWKFKIYRTASWFQWMSRTEWLPRQTSNLCEMPCECRQQESDCAGWSWSTMAAPGGRGAVGTAANIAEWFCYPMCNWKPLGGFEWYIFNINLF